jgi:hypothetical protein
MKCNLVLPQEWHGWVIEKMTRRLADEICALGSAAEVAVAASSGADINHFMAFMQIPPEVPPHSTVSITHVDDSVRFRHALIAAKTAELAICMSSWTVKQLVDGGGDRAKLCFVLPALDEGLLPRRIVIGLTTKLYKDGRKREKLLVRLSREMDLSDFHFDIFGTGWDNVVPHLRQAGALVTLAVDSGDDQADYQRMRERIPHFDYYLYMGLDEGSLGTLDALAAGVKTIVTPHGFHVDLPHGITHPFREYGELRAVFESIREERNVRVRAVECLTWRKYAERHLSIWEAMLQGRLRELPRLLGQESLTPAGSYGEGMERAMASERRRLIFTTLRRYGTPRIGIKSGAVRLLKKCLPRPVFSRLFRNG